MKEIKISQGFVAVVDDEDFEYLSQFKWYAAKFKRKVYAGRGIKKNGKWTSIMMHRDLLNVPQNMQTDHIDNDGLNNQRSNLRICTVYQNSMNQRSPLTNKTSKFKGVSWFKPKNRWGVRIRVDKKSKHIGWFKDEREAALAHDKAADFYFGEFSLTNYKLGLL